MPAWGCGIHRSMHESIMQEMMSPPVRTPSNALPPSDNSLLPPMQRIPRSFACQPKDWDCANFRADKA